jgi:hypothetical protein
MPDQSVQQASGSLDGVIGRSSPLLVEGAIKRVEVDTPNDLRRVTAQNLRRNREDLGNPQRDHLRRPRGAT